jgi:hypothetical protein
MVNLNKLQETKKIWKYVSQFVTIICVVYAIYRINEFLTIAIGIDSIDGALIFGGIFGILLANAILPILSWCCFWFYQSIIKKIIKKNYDENITLVENSNQFKDEYFLKKNALIELLEGQIITSDIYNEKYNNLVLECVKIIQEQENKQKEKESIQLLKNGLSANVLTQEEYDFKMNHLTSSLKTSDPESQLKDFIEKLDK